MSIFLKCFSLYIFILLPVFVPAQIVINEVSSNNQNQLKDEEGAFEDWIEIYNSGTSPVNIGNYSLLDNTPVIQQWVFPSFTLAPDAHILVFASGKNKKETFHHWETAVLENDYWRYLIPSVEPSGTWNTPAFDDALWTLAKGGIGYGDGDDSTVLALPVTSLYLRKTFTIADTSKVVNALLHIDYDDAFVAYLNGVEIARGNILGNPPGFGALADVEHEAQVYQSNAYEKHFINREALRSILRNGNNVLAIQVHNLSSASSDLSIRANLSFGMKDAGTQFGSVPSWFKEPTASFHTNFKLSKDGNETLYLLDNTSSLIDQQLLPIINIDHSFGRQPDGSGNWYHFDSPSPASSNNDIDGYLGYCTDALLFSIDGGFYPTSQALTIAGSSNIRYTLDGSEPTISSALYTGPVPLNATTVVRAACISLTHIPAKIYTNTYFINDNNTLPVISLSTHPDNFFDDTIGIYMLGPNADSVTNPHFGANFWEDWERPVHVEFFDKQKKLGFEQDAGVKIFGNYSRANPMKSLWIKAHDRYGKNRIEYPFFKDKNIQSFKEIILRNSGNDFGATYIKDATNHMAVFGKTDIDIQAYEPCVVYINGDYWGIHHIREKVNEHYVAQNHGLDKDSIDLSDAWGTALQGENNIWALWWIVNNYDLSDYNVFKVVADSFDLENMVDYFAAEIYISNWDWPQNNLKFWRPKYGERKYRYLLYDTDISLGIWGMQRASFNQLGKVKNESYIKVGPHAVVFSNMLKYIPFRNYFINRSADLMNTIYTPANFSKVAYTIRDSIAAEMPRHITRWNGDPGYREITINEMIDFMGKRPDSARYQMRTEFNLVKEVNVTLNVSPAGAGYIKMNSVYPDTYPWTGVYFDGVPVTITAVPNPGYSFSHWQSAKIISSPNSNKSVTLNVDQNDSFTANFTGSAGLTQLTVSEVNYNSSLLFDSGDWIELHNYGTTAVDVSNWVMKNYKDYNSFIFPVNTLVPPGAYLVICSDTNKFKSAYPSVRNYIGQFDFSLNDLGDMIRLYDFRGIQYLSFSYDDQSPWPVQANGQGYTLELIDPQSNLNNSSNWFSGCFEGSPGSPYNSSCILGNQHIAEENSGILFYPNPSKGKFRIVVEDKHLSGDLKIVNAQGQIIYEAIIPSSPTMFSVEIDLTRENPGLFNLLFSTENGIITQKLIIAH